MYKLKLFMTLKCELFPCVRMHYLIRMIDDTIHSFGVSANGHVIVSCVFASSLVM